MVVFHRIGADIGRNIIKERRKKGWTQGQLARAIAMSQKSLSKIETGKAYPKYETLIDLHHALGVSLDELAFGGTGHG